jgi:hypothetical protein
VLNEALVTSEPVLFLGLTYVLLSSPSIVARAESVLYPIIPPDLSDALGPIVKGSPPIAALLAFAVEGYVTCAQAVTCFPIFTYLPDDDVKVNPAPLESIGVQVPSS